MNTGQNLGITAMATAPAASTASARTMTPRLERVSSMAAPMGVCAARPSRLLTVVTRPTRDWLQCCCVTRKTFKKGPRAPRTSASRKFVASRDREWKRAFCPVCFRDIATKCPSRSIVRFCGLKVFQVLVKSTVHADWSVNTLPLLKLQLHPDCCLGKPL